MFTNYLKYCLYGLDVRLSFGVALSCSRPLNGRKYGGVRIVSGGFGNQSQNCLDSARLVRIQNTALSHNYDQLIRCNRPPRRQSEPSLIRKKVMQVSS